MNDMTERIVERLDRAKPPPGHEVYGAFDGGWWFSPVGFDPDVGDEGFALYDFAKAAAWEHYEARHDPPGMCVYRDDEGDAPTWLWYIGVGKGPAIDGGDQDHHIARAAAWAWYWRRVVVSLVMEASGIEAYKSMWPACLAWPNETVAHHEAAMRLMGNIREELQGMMDFRGIVPWKP